MTKIKLFITIILILFISLNIISALTVESVDAEKLYPGKTASIKLDIKNNLNEDVEDVSVLLNLDKTLFTSIGSSEESQDQIDDGDKEAFSFVVKAPSNIKTGDYNIPYTITYTDSNNEKKTKTGSFGISVSAKTELSYTLDAETNVINEKGKVSFKIINSGLGDINFVSVNVVSSNGIDLLSNKEIYIGTVSSDDFETANFNVLYKQTSASMTIELKYKDSENNDQTDIVTLPIKVYTKEKGLELGIIKKRNAWMYGTIIGIVIIWLVYKKIKKRKK